MKNVSWIYVFVLLAGNFVAMAPASHAAPVGMAKRLIEQLHMERIPQEGPWFTVTYVGKDQLSGASLPRPLQRQEPRHRQRHL